MPCFPLDKNSNLLNIYANNLKDRYLDCGCSRAWTMANRYVTQSPNPRAYA